MANGISTIKIHSLVPKPSRVHSQFKFPSGYQDVLPVEESGFMAENLET